MKELFQGTLEVENYHQGLGFGKRGRGWVTVPLQAVEAAGLVPGQLRVAAAAEGVVAIVVSHGHLPDIRQLGDGRLRISFTTYGVGMSSKPQAPAAVALAVSPGRIEIIVPEAFRNVGRPRPKQEPQPRRVYDGAYLTEAAGLYGAARALALDAGRRGASRVRALAADQAADVLREAGHRVQQLSPRLWSIDGKTASLADLAEAAHRIDAGAVLVAEAA